MESQGQHRPDSGRLSKAVALKEQLQQWRQRHPGPNTAVHDFDADGLCAAALWKRSLGGTTQVVHGRKTLPPLQHSAELVFTLDLSCPEDTFPWDLPTVVIDHHPQPARPPAETLLLHRSDRCTAWLAHELLGGPDWIAVIGILSDLGDSAPSPLLQGQLDLWGINPLRQLTSLVNSAHRAGGDCDRALEALLQHESPSQMIHSTHPSVTYLRDCQRKVRKRLGQAKQISPTYYGNIALVEFHSDCPVQSIVAQIWKSRLTDKVVLVANLRSDRAEVHLSARSRGTLSAIETLRQRGLVLRGHPNSAGAVLTPEEWQNFSETLRAHSH